MRKSLANNDCHIARAADQIGDGWIILILWATSNGINRFDDLQRELGVARNILSDRLRRMVKSGLLEKKPVQEGARRLEYKSTAKSKDLQDILASIHDWSEQWCPIETEEPSAEKRSAETTTKTDQRLMSA